MQTCYMKMSRKNSKRISIELIHNGSSLYVGYADADRKQVGIIFPAPTVVYQSVLNLRDLIAEVGCQQSP